MQKVALITGTGSGIGKAFAELLLSKDYIVYGYSRTNYIQHANFIFTAIDLSNLESVKELQFPKCKSEDILLVNNAATIGEAMPLHLKKDATIINDYNLNIIAPTLLCSKFMNSYADTQKLIINIGSGAANNAIASWNTYCPTKSALDMLTKHSQLLL